LKSNGVDIETVERELELPNLTDETKKAIRWILTKQSSRRRLNAADEEAGIAISRYSCATLQYPTVDDPIMLITERMRSTDQHQYGKDRNRTAPRYDTVLIRWSDSNDAEHCMSNRRVGRILLLFSTTYKLSLNEEKPIELAYVEWFRLINNGWDNKTEMFKVKKAESFGVIDIRSIERGVHLVPCFKGFNTQKNGQGVQPSLDEYKEFWINNWIDRHMYNTIYGNPEKWDHALV
jgi:hypothetical protein